MFLFINRTLFDIPTTWDRIRFKTTRSKYRQARKLIEISINVQFEKQLRNLHQTNLNIAKSTTEINEHLSKHEKKVNIFDNLTEIASQSLSTHFDTRMENIRTIIQKHCNAIQTLLQNENHYWKDIHSAIDQNLITSNDIHPCIHNTSELSIDNVSSNEDLLITKEQRVSVVLPSINKTYLIKFDETKNRLSSIYSQPNPPGQLYFSPTFLQDKQSESIRNVLSPIDQNQTILSKPKIIIHRIDQKFLLDYLKTEESVSKSRTPSATKIESISNTIALRKRKSVTIITIEEQKSRKRRKRKTIKKQIPIRDPSPLPLIDRSKHYSTRFSSRSHRLNNFENNDDDDDNHQLKPHSRLRKKKTLISMFIK